MDQHGAIAFMEGRKAWFSVRAIDNPDGSWEVLLRIDGTYCSTDARTKQEMVEYFERWLAEVCE